VRPTLAARSAAVADATASTLDPRYSSIGNAPISYPVIEIESEPWEWRSSR
jgi:hypothetical protein